MAANRQGGKTRKKAAASRGWLHLAAVAGAVLAFLLAIRWALDRPPAPPPTAIVLPVPPAPEPPPPEPEPPPEAVPELATEEPRLPPPLPPPIEVKRMKVNIPKFPALPAPKVSGATPCRFGEAEKDGKKAPKVSCPKERSRR